MTNRRLWPMVVGGLVAAWLVAPPPAGATLRFGPLSLSGNVQSQNLFRTPDASTWQYVQNRNTVHLRLDYDWLEGGKFITKYNIPFIEKSALTMLWRGVYDSIYSYTPDVLQKKTLQGNNYPGGLNFFEYATQVGPTGIGPLRRNQLNLQSIGNDGLDALRFENVLREAFIDLKFRGVPLTVRAGRQQIVWGETDNNRILDRVNALDLTWHLQQELPPPAFGWDEIRRPYWMLKFVYDLGNVWKLSQSFLEWYWNPGDWQPAKVDYLPRPWSLPFYHPLTNVLDGGFFDGPCFALSPIRATTGPRRGQPQCTRLLKNTRFLIQGDYNRNPMENSQVGVRYHGITPQGLEFTLNYFYQRWTIDGVNSAPLEVLPCGGLDQNGQCRNQQRANRLFERGIFPAEAIFPYVHGIGASANYSDETYTQAVFRMETVFDLGIPFFDVSKPGVIDPPAIPGITKKDMWRGMIGFDRQTWIRWLNKKTTWFITGQLFWQYLIDRPNCEPQVVANLPLAERSRRGECLVGALDIPSSLRTEAVSFRDKIRTWESFFTLAAFSFYRGGSIVPTVGMAVDFVNSWNMEPFWSFDYVVRDDFVVNLAQRWFVTPQGNNPPIFEAWGLAGQNFGRTETSLRVTYQF